MNHYAQLCETNWMAVTTIAEDKNNKGNKQIRHAESMLKLKSTISTGDQHMTFTLYAIN